MCIGGHVFSVSCHQVKMAGFCPKVPKIHCILRAIIVVNGFPVTCLDAYNLSVLVK